jgi:hypothetical protein
LTHHPRILNFAPTKEKISSSILRGILITLSSDHLGEGRKVSMNTAKDRRLISMLQNAMVVRNGVDGVADLGVHHVPLLTQPNEVVDPISYL